MADRNPNRMSNWKLVCHLCAVPFLDREDVQAMRDHFDRLHGGAEINMRLVWVGKGPAPKGQPSPPKYN